MQLTWRQRLEQQPSLMDLKEWPQIDALQVARNKRGIFLRNQKIIAQALAQLPFKEIASAHQIHPTLVTHLLNRVLGGNEDQMPALTKGLIPGYRIHPGERLKPLSSLTDPSGNAHSFNYLLENVPGLKHYLTKLIKMFVRRDRRGQNLRVDTFHKAFLRFLRQSHWPTDRYPFNTECLGYESIRKYFHRQLNLLTEPNEPERIILPLTKPVSIFAEIEIDEHTVDCHGSVVVVLNDVWEPLRLGRVVLIAARDVASSAVLAAVLVLRGYVTRDDVLALLAALTGPWETPELKSPGLHFPPGSWMPNSLGAEFRRPTYGIFRFDNAMVHRAFDVRDFICDELGATLNLGIPKYPLARVLIESAFRDLNLTVHRLPSTTGSHANDPLREPAQHQKKAPVVSIKSLEEMIWIHIADMNRRALGNLGSASPIDVMQHQMANHWVPLRPECALRHVDPNRDRRELTVHYESSQHRRPWINFAHLRYDAPGVLDSSLRKKKIHIEFDRRDVRHVRAFTLEGEYLGTLSAPESWLRFSHSLSTRKLIMKRSKKYRLTMDDPLGAYYDYLISHRDLPVEALELVRVTREFGDHAAPKPDVQLRLPKPPDRVKQPEIDESFAIPDWSPSMMDERRD